MSKFLIYGGGVPKKLPKAACPSLTGSLSGKIVFFETTDTQGKRCEVAGIVPQHTKGDDRIEVRLAIPDPVTGILMISDSTVLVKASELTERDAVFDDKRKVSGYVLSAELPDADLKSVIVRGEGGVVTDYQDVSFSAYASTWEDVTPRDRIGDYIIRGAFKETIPAFKRNPVMLMDHHNSVKMIAGSYADVREDDRGLKVYGKMSNAPGLIDVRFLISEKHLKTLSIGGIWIYKSDGFGIEKAYLFEISLTPVPCNPDALIEKTAIGIEQAAKAFGAKRFIGSPS